MTEIMPIPADSADNNARRFLELKNELLVDNGIGKFAHTISGIYPESQYAAWSQSAAFREAYTTKAGHQYVGAFEREEASLKLVGAMELKPVTMIELSKFFRPIDRIAAIYGANRGYSTETYLAISSLVARKGDDQALILQDLLYTAIDREANASNTLYLSLPSVDPVHEVADALGFKPTGIGTSNKHGIPHSLLVRSIE